MSLTRKDQTLKVLIVEDEVTIARNLFSIVSQYATVKMVHTYEDAVAILPDYKPSLLLLDVNLEGSSKNGIDFAAEYKEKYQFEVIFITAYFDGLTFSNASKLTPLNYIIKPFKKSQLVITLKLIIAKIWMEETKKEDISKHLEELTPNEKRILYLVSLGLSPKLIALESKKSTKSIFDAQKLIESKLGLENSETSLLEWSIAQRDHILKVLQ